MSYVFDNAKRVISEWQDSPRTNYGNPQDVVQYVRKLEEDVKNLLEVCNAYELWEGDIIINGNWGADGMAPYPRLRESQYDRMLELQDMRNEAIRKARGQS